MAESLWGFVIIGGPILLALVLIWAIFNNRTTRREDERTEEATRRLYDEQARADAERDRQ